jgi:polysaccharide export outer membrane protein
MNQRLQTPFFPPKAEVPASGRWLGLFSPRRLAMAFCILLSAAAWTGRAQSAAPATNPAAGPAIFTSTNVNQLDDRYKLVIGDQLSFRIIEDEEDPRLLVVTDSGDIEVPYLGRYPVIGKTCKELAANLKTELEKRYYYQATVIVAVNAMPRSRGKIYLVGAIRAPGPQDISSEETLTVSKAILRAGGFNDFANQKKVKITRTTGKNKDDVQTFLVDVSSVFEKGSTQNDIALQPGDLIYVPERLIRF